MNALRDFAPTGDDAIRRGITLLEASAGTGKTYNITSAVIRLVAEHDVPMRRILVVTFTRAATAELEDRIRTRIGEAIAVLEGRARPGDDEILAMLAKNRTPKWLANLRAARESFDECVISTIHGFCQRMLQQNAFESRTAFDLDLMTETETSDLLAQIADDWLSSNLHADDRDRYELLVNVCGFSRDWIINLARLALRDPDAPVLPSCAEATPATWRAECDAFLPKWKAHWGKSLPPLFEQAHKRGAFDPPAQRTYRETQCADEVDTVTKWLATRPAVGTLPENATYFSEAAITAKLSGKVPAPENEALLALRRLLGYVDRVAACEAARLTEFIRTETQRRLLAQGSQSFQDLMRTLARVLRTKDRGRNALVSAIGSRFDAVLIDEFQDTDALQWTIFSEIFGDDRHWLYLIGDPKQAIYGFRGANVHVYLQARGSADKRVFTIRRNFRSDQRLLDALNHVLGSGDFFGEAGIDFVRVEAAPRTGEPTERISYGTPPHDPWTAPLQLRFIDGRLDGARQVTADDASLAKGLVGRLLPDRVTNDIVDLLESGTRVYDPKIVDAEKDGFRPLRPGDIAVLTSTGDQVLEVHDALLRANVPAVLRGAASVLESDEALDLQRWLEALAAPGDDRAARTAATTRLFGRDATLIARVEAQDPEALKLWEQWLERLSRWRHVFARHGFLLALRTATEQDVLPASSGTGNEDVTARLLRRPDGERRLTNVWHVAELLHEAETADRLHLSGLLAWLQRQRVKAAVDSETAEMRLERDDDAVSVMTMHRAKGLEYPVVFVPYLWDGHHPRANEPLLVPRADNSAERVLDLRSNYVPEVLERAELENRKEQLRVLYVALTRARYRCVVYTGHINLLARTALAPTMHGSPPNRIDSGSKRVEGCSRADLFSDLAELAARSRATLPDGCPTIALSFCEKPRERIWQPPEKASPPLAVRNFDRWGLDRTWRRHSYSSVAHGKKIERADDDEREGFDSDGESSMAHEVTGLLPDYVAPGDAASVPLAAFPAGADAGTLIHEIFEKTDFAWARPGSDPGTERQFADVVVDLLGTHGFDADEWSGVLRTGLLDVMRTPLAGPLGRARLCDIGKGSRFDELRFDFPIAGGSAFGREGLRARVTSDRIARALKLRKRSSHADDEQILPAAWLDALGDLGSLSGFMTGSVDLVFRHEIEGHQRWFVVDYKSNRLDPHRTGRCPIEHYGLDFMRHAMQQSAYYLQYHIYVLALHRYLRLRLGRDAHGTSVYDYDRDMGGVYYLFLRGMIGEKTPMDGRFRHGCFFDKPPFEVIDALDRLFDDPGDTHGGAR